MIGKIQSNLVEFDSESWDRILKINTKTMFEIKKDLTKAENLIKLVQNHHGFGYQDQGKAFLLDLKSFKLEFMMMFMAVRNQITKNGLDPLPKEPMLEHYQNTKAEFKSEIRLIKAQL